MRRRVNKLIKLLWRKKIYLYISRGWNNDDDIIVVVVHCCFCCSYYFYFPSLVHYVKCEVIKKKMANGENIERREWRGLFRWPFVIFMSIIINVEIILTLTHVPFLGYLYSFLRRKKGKRASKFVIDINAHLNLSHTRNIDPYAFVYTHASATKIFLFRRSFLQ